jgi:hypothetical protein
MHGACEAGWLNPTVLFGLALAGVGLRTDSFDPPDRTTLREGTLEFHE